MANGTRPEVIMLFLGLLHKNLNIILHIFFLHLPADAEDPVEESDPLS